MNRATTGGSCARSPLSIIAGSAASDDRDANATACAGVQNATNAGGDICPARMPSGYSSTTPPRTVSATTSAM